MPLWGSGFPILGLRCWENRSRQKVCFLGRENLQWIMRKFYGVCTRRKPGSPVQIPIKHTYGFQSFVVVRGTSLVVCPYRHKPSCDSVGEIMPVCVSSHTSEAVADLSCPSCRHLLIGISYCILAFSRDLQPKPDVSLGFLWGRFDIVDKDLGRFGYQLIVIAKGESSELWNFLLLLSEQITPQVL